MKGVSFYSTPLAEEGLNFMFLPSVLVPDVTPFGVASKFKLNSSIGETVDLLNCTELFGESHL